MGQLLFGLLILHCQRGEQGTGALLLGLLHMPGSGMIMAPYSAQNHLGPPLKNQSTVKKCLRLQFHW